MSDFGWALDQMRQGKRVKRSTMRSDSRVFEMFRDRTYIVTETLRSPPRFIETMLVEDIMANDWICLED